MEQRKENSGWWTCKEMLLFSFGASLPKDQIQVCLISCKETWTLIKMGHLISSLLEMMEVWRSIILMLKHSQTFDTRSISKSLLLGLGLVMWVAQVIARRLSVQAFQEKFKVLLIKSQLKLIHLKWKRNNRTWKNFNERKRNFKINCKKKCNKISKLKKKNCLKSNHYHKHKLLCKLQISKHLKLVILFKLSLMRQLTNWQWKARSL